MNDDLFTPPPFKADEAFATLRRSLRDLRLVERAGRFELAGRPVVELVLDAAAIRVRTAKRPALTPEWNACVLRSGADLRRYTDDLKRQLARWSQSDD